ncbi:MAG TPA: tRNA uracil 4-sulfurtransferase ThiI [Kofleriaceae bacterium]|nr:tRNA uracil 4-sulfurtransferase ThiI [Kofleriaceae bacterium]
MRSSPSDKGVVVLRLGEIFLKGKNRHAFVSKLVAQARRLLAPVQGATVQALHLRILVRHPAEQQRQVLERLGRLFGLHSMWPAVVVPQDLDAIAEAAIDEARGIAAGTTFKVESNRRDKRFPRTSQEISQLVGGRVHEATGLPVDVHDPARVIQVELGEELTFVASRVVPGPGGLPIGTAGHVGLLLSGGIDSPVAGWSVMRRGCTLTAVYFHSFPFTGDKTKHKVVDVARALAPWHGPLRLRVVHFTDVQKALRDHGPPEMAVLLYRRMMMRAASRIVAAEGGLALVTGENLGQVASQTLANLGVIEDAAELPVLRPLLTYDKSEIIARAQAIGTYETSIQPYDDTCSLFVPKHPATRARVVDAQRAESGLDVAAMADALAANAEKIDISS